MDNLFTCLLILDVLLYVAFPRLVPACLSVGPRAGGHMLHIQIHERTSSNEISICV